MVWKIRKRGDTPWVDAELRRDVYARGRPSTICAGVGMEDSKWRPPENLSREEVYTVIYPSPRCTPGSSGQIVLEGFSTNCIYTCTSSGLAVWEASNKLCEHLVNSDALSQNCMQILELGSGLGKCGLFATRISQSTITVLMDGDTNVLKIL